jgi:MFS family permease
MMEILSEDVQTVSREGRTSGRTTVVGAGLNLFLGTGQLLLFTFGVFVKPIVADTGWDRAIVGSATLYGQLLLALCAPFAGLAIDRFGPRVVARFAGPLLAAGMCLIGYLATNQSTFLMAVTLSFLLGALQVPVTYVKAIAAWYRQRLGLALGAAMLFSGIGVAALPPMAAWLISAFGWRVAYLCLGVLVGVVNILSVTLLIREPSSTEAKGRCATPAGRSLLLSSLPLLRSREFCAMAVSFFLISVVVGGGTWALPVVLNDLGMSAQRSSSVMVVVGVSMTVARLGFGMLLDKLEPRRLSALAFVGAAVGMAILATTTSPMGVVIAGLLMGVALGSEVDAMAFLTTRVFGVANLGAMYGALSFCFSLGLGCGPALLSAVMKANGSYVAGFWATAAAGGIAALTILTAPIQLAHENSQSRSS